MSAAVGQPNGDSMVVRAVGGFAYGAMGADIHVFGDGTPVYLLFEHHRLRNSDPRWLRAQPSRMLNARAEVVEFTGRETELGELVTWRDADPLFAVRWLHGEGGQGKTRLAARLAADSERLGWKVVDAVHGTETHWPAPGSQDLRRGGTKGVLILIDYADRWPLTDLSWLFNNTLLNPGIRRRVLLIARSAFEWPSVCHKLARLEQEVDTSDQLLPSLPGDGPARAQMFAVARDCFAHLYPPVAEPSAIGPPSPLDNGEFELTLAIHMAALVAVDAAACGRKPPADMLGLTVYLLHREHENWRQLCENAERGLDYHTPDRTMARTVFVSILTGAVTATTATKVLGTMMPDASAGQVLTDHAICYPADDPSMALAPMLPDRLAEDFLALMVPGHPITGFQPDDWAATAPEILLTSAIAPSGGNRAVTFLASTADRWPHVGERVLYPLLLRKPGIAVDAGSAALTVIAQIGGTGTEIDGSLLKTLTAIEPVLPDGQHADLDLGILAVTERLTAVRLARNAHPVPRAWLYGQLGRRRAHAGLWRQALEADEEAARLNRDLSDADDRYLPHLAGSLIDLGSVLSHLERQREALVQYREAVAITRDLAAGDPRGRVGLAVSLAALGSQLTEFGRAKDALVATEEAVTIRRELAATESDGAPHLAEALNNLAARLGTLGRREDVLAAMEEATAIYRQQATQDPASHLIPLAASLINLGQALARLDRYDQMAVVTEEAVALYRRLSAANPAAHRPALVTALLNLAAAQAEMDQPSEAADLIEEAVGISRQLAEGDPVAHRIGLARALSSLGSHLSQAGQHAEALAALREASDLYMKSHSAASATDLENVQVLRELAALYQDVGDRANEGIAELNLCAFCLSAGLTEDGIAAGRRAASLCREIGDRDNEAAALLNLGSALGRLGQADEAVASCERAIELFREAGAAEHEAIALPILSFALIKAGRPHEAVAAAERARDIAAELGTELTGHPLFNLGSALMAIGKPDKSVEALQQAAALYKDTGRGPYEPSGNPRREADALDLLAHRLFESGQFEEAIHACHRMTDLYQLTGNRKRERAAQLLLSASLASAGRRDEAIEACQDLLARSRETGDQEGVAQALTNLGVALYEAGRAADAINVCEQAVTACRKVDDTSSEASALFNLGESLSLMGRTEEAIDPYRRSARAWSELGDSGHESRAIHGLGTAMFLLNRPEDAATAFRRELEIRQESGDHSNEAATLLALCQALGETGKLEEALPIGHRAVKAFAAQGDPAGRCLALSRVAEALTGLRRFTEAAKACRKAAEAWRSVGGTADAKEGEGEALMFLGEILVETGRNGEGVEALRRSVELFHEAGDARGGGRAMSGLGLSLLRLGEYDKAVSVCHEAITMCRLARELDGKRSAQVNLSIALQRAERYQESIEASHDALDACREINYAAGVTSMLENLGFACLKVGQYQKSVEWHEQMLNHIPREDAARRAKTCNYIRIALGELGELATHD